MALTKQPITTTQPQDQSTEEEYDYDPHMMHYESSEQVKATLALLGDGKPVPRIYKDGNEGQLAVCTGGTMECRAFDGDVLRDLLPDDPGFDPALRAASRVLKNSWKTTKRYLLRQKRRETGIPDLDVGIALTPKGPQLVFCIGHGSETHNALAKAGKAKAGKGRLAVDKAPLRGVPKHGQTH